MPFEFIDSAVIDRDARKRIRRHVMIGKNSGKTKPPRAKPPISTSTTLRLPQHREVSETPLDPGHPDPVSEETAVAVCRPVTSDLSMFSFPETLSPRYLKYMHTYFNIISSALYPPDFCTRTDIGSSVWVQYMFRDKAYFHCSLALSVVTVDLHIANPQDNPESLRHLSHTLHLVNERLSGHEALSDPTFASIICMCIYERLHGRYDEGLVHLQGLRRMVELRGGISHLADNLALVQKIFRADLEFALYYGSSTLFDLQDIPGQEILSELRDKFSHSLESHAIGLHFLEGISLEMQDVFMDFLSLDHYLKCTRTSKLSPQSFQAVIIRIGYKVFRVNALNNFRVIDCFEAIFRLAMTAFLTSFWQEYGRIPCRFPLLYDLLRTTVEENSLNGFRDRKILLWIILTSKGSVFTDADNLWLEPIVAGLSTALGLDTWEDTRRTLNKLPWANALHENPGRALWEKALGCQNEVILLWA